MKKRILHICVVAILLISTSSVNAQWVETNGPCGGYVSLGRNGNSLYAGTPYGQMYLSVNNGLNWTSISNGLPSGLNLGVSSPVFQGATIFTSVEGKLYSSANNGGNWNLVNNDIPYSNISALAVDGSNIFASSAGQIYLSTNGGINWTDLTLFVFKPSAGCIAIKNKIIYGGSENGLMISTDYGNNWNLYNSGLPSNTWIKSLNIQGENIYAGTYGRGVYLSTDSGHTWNPVNNGLPSKYSLPTVYSLELINNNIYIGTDNGIFLSTDSGQNWIDVTNNLSNREVGPIISNDSGIYIASGNSGVWFSNNYGNNWSGLNNGLINSWSCRMAVEGSIVYAGSSTTGIYSTKDYGDNWDLIDNTSCLFSCLLTNDSGIFAATDQGVLLSIDSGKDWQQSSYLPSPNGYNYVYSLGSYNSELFAGVEESGVFGSDDNGMHWTSLNATLPVHYDEEDDPINLYPSPSSFAFVDSDIFMGTDLGIFTSTDNGSSWIAMNNGMSQYSSIYHLTVTGKNIYAGTNNGIFMSNDLGNNWTSLNNGVPDSGITALTSMGNNILCASNKQVYFSQNMGTTWKNISDGLPNLNIVSFAIDSTEIFAATELTGIWKRALSEILGINESTSNIDFAIYPNPATNQLAIHTSAFHNEAITISIMNVLGQEASPPTPLQGRGEDPLIDVSKLSSGIYFIQLKTESGSVVRKFVKE